MPISTVNVSSPSNEIVFTDTAMGAAIDGIKASSAQVYSISVNNLLNGTSVYLKLYNLASGSVIVGTTAPDQIVLVPANAIVVENYFTSGSTPGKTFAVALSAACVTTGGTTGTTSPASSVIVSVSYV